MKQVTVWGSLIVLIGILASAAFFFTGNPAKETAIKTESPSNTTNRTDFDTPKPPETEKKSAEIVTLDEALTSRYGEEKQRRVIHAITLLGESLAETKGLKAEVIYASGGSLKLRVPPLQISEQELEDQIAKLLVKFTGDSDSTEVAKNPDLLARIKFLLCYELLRSDLTYEFEKIDTRNFPDSVGAPTSYDFSMIRTANRDLDGNPVLQQYSDNRFDLGKAGNQYTISWSALSRAPAGYFSSHTIRGNEGKRGWKGLEASEDIKTGESVIFDYNTGKEIRIPSNK